MAKNIEIKTKCPKIKSKVPRWMIAEAAQCTESTVKAIQNGYRSHETEAGQRIKVAQMLLEEGFNKLITEVKKLVAFWWNS